ncbi:glycosyltransferase family 4 protein [Prevotella sp. E2-28]|uniref:glycosyltransferase family 4 protein n=1 Tax=Prevotella sp. E2-28 TaxID=2913620 RepID=UPI001EDB50C6|nr:glycosyltransferase family 4 protein [Prevotella sp. E2-28]UKK54778.1 glycosyltransferase family 4 protein [Prevotella sp. E2-28]
MAFIKGFSEQRLTTHVTFLVSDDKGSKVKEVFPHVDFIYMWDKFPIKNRLISQIQLEYNARRYTRLLPKGATVFLPWPSSRLMSLLVGRSDLKVFYEETELPELYLMKLFNIKSYLKSIQKLTGVFLISTALKKYFIEHGVSPERIHIVNMIVDTTRFHNVLKEKSHERYIAYCGTVTSTKDGVDDLIKAFAIVNKKHPDVKLFIIGPIPGNKEENVFVKLVGELGLTDSVHFTGIVPYDKMPQILKNAEILALARPDNIQAKYGFPTKLGEYLLTGNPVVLTSVGDIPHFLKDGESALIATPNNPNLFAEKLNWALDYKDESEQLGQKGRSVAENCFNYKTETQKIINIING